LRRDLCVAYAVATRRRDAALLGQLAPQMGAAFQVFGEKSNKVALYAPVRTVQSFDGLIKDLLGLAPGFIQTLEGGQLYEEFAKNVDGLIVSLNQLIFDPAQQALVELGMEKITLSDVQNEGIDGTLPVICLRVARLVSICGGKNAATLGHNAAKNFGAYPSFRGRRHHSLEREFLCPATVLEFRRVKVAVRIRGHVVENVKLTGLIAHSASEITEDLERLAVEDQYPLMAAVDNVQVALLRIW
jgi:hypothetical protein